MFQSFVSIQEKKMCNRFSDFATKELQELNKLENLIHESVGSKKRAKRGLINVIGQVQKLLFGTMDSEDANFINEKLHTLTSDEREIQTLMSKQLTVLKSAISDFNLHAADSLEFEKDYTHTITDVVYTINNQTALVNDMNKMVKLNSFKTNFQTLVGQQKNILQNILDALILINKGVLSPYVIAPHQIIQKFKECATGLFKHLLFPFPLSLDYGFLVYKVAELCAFVKDEILVYSVKMPLVESIAFDVFNVIPIPKLIKMNKFVIIDNKLKQVAVDEERQTYVSLNMQDLDDCVEVWSKYWVCKKPFIFRNIYKNPVCDLQLFLGDDKNNCQNKRDNSSSVR